MARHPVGRLLIWFAGVAGCALAQNFDTSADPLLNGTYYVREILISGQAADGAITSAIGVIGTATFDGKGNYSFSGQRTTSTSGAAANLSASGTYGVGSNGLLQIVSIADASDLAYGGVSALGPSGFVASATEGTGVDILIGIPANSKTVSNAALAGNYSAGYIDFLNADIGMVREGTFSASADGAGTFGAIAVTGMAANLGGTSTTQLIPGVSYSLSGQGAGTISFGTSSATQLLSGGKNLYISADQNIILAASPDGFDLLVGIRSLSGPATNSTASGEYFLAGLEDATGSLATGGNAIDGFYGSEAATGAGASIFHSRLQSFAQPVYDYTFATQYTVNSEGAIAPGDLPYTFTLGAGEKAFVATGTSGLYSLVIGLETPSFNATGVYIDPLGVVNAATFAPITNPIAPNELVALFGSGFTTAAAQAPSLPLPQTLGGAQLTVNGEPAPLLYVTPGQLAFLVPSDISPANGVYYATIKLTSNGKTSNAVTVFTSNSAPGVFTQTASGFGAAAAQLANYSLVTSSNPATAGGTVVLYLCGGGQVSPGIANGTAAPSNPPSMDTEPGAVDLGGVPASVNFAGLTPGASGLYQINLVVPPTMGAGDVYVDLSTPDAYTSAATITVGSATPVPPANAARRIRSRRSAPPLAAKSAGLIGRQGAGVK